MDKQKEKDIPFKPGDAVRVEIQNIDSKLGKKLTPAFKGIYIVHKVLDSIALITCIETFKKFRVNFKQLKLIKTNDNEITRISDLELNSSSDNANNQLND